jgi:tetratricopeptide (TPR) repeat protein
MVPNVTSITAEGVLEADGVPEELVDRLRLLLGPEVPPDADSIEKVLAADDSLAEEVERFVEEAARTVPPVATIVDFAHAGLLSEAEDWNGAKGRYAAILGRDPDNAAAEFLLAGCLAHLGQTDDAVMHLQRAAELSPDDPDDAVLIADLYDQLGRPDDALASARRAWALAPLHPMDLDRQGQLAVTLSNHDDDGLAADVLVGLLGRAEVNDELAAAASELLARIRLGQERPEEGEEVLRGVEERLGTLAERPMGRLWMASALVAQNRAAEALPYADAGLLDEVPATLRRQAAWLRASALLETQALEEAIPLFDEVVEGGDDLQGQVAALLKGIALVGLGRLDEARAVLDEVARRLAEDCPPWLRGRTALYQGIAWNGEDPDRALELFEVAEAQLPADWSERPLPTLWLALLLRERDPARAVTLVEGVPDVPPPLVPMAAQTRFDALVKQGRLAEAMEPLETLVEHSSGEDRGWRVLLRARLKRQLGDGQGALADARALLVDATDEGLRDQASLTQALAYLDESDLDAARRILEELRESGADQRCRGDVLGLEFAIGSAAGDTALVGAVLPALAELDPSLVPLARLATADAATLSGQMGQAMQVLRTVTDPADPANPYHLVIAAYARRVLGQVGGPELIEQAMAIDPAIAAWPLAGLERGFAAAGRGDVDEVDECLREASAPNRLVLLDLRAAARQALDPPDLDGALSDLAQLTTEAEAGGDIARLLRAKARAVRALVLLRSDRLGEVQAELDAADKASAGLPAHGVHNLVRLEAEGILRLRQERHAEADACFAEASRLADLAGVSDLRYVLEYLRGVNAMVQGDDHQEDALRWLRRAAAQKPEDTDVQEAIGDVLLRLEDPHRSLLAYDAALASAGSTSRRASLLLDRATALRKLGMLEAGTEAARQSLELTPEAPRAWLVLAAVHEEAGRTGAAIAAYSRGLALSEDDHNTARLLVGLSHAYLLAGKPRDAADLLKRPAYRRLAGEEGLIPFNLGVAHLDLNEPDEAARQFEAAARATSPRADGAQLAVRVRQGQGNNNNRASWLGFWFLGQTRERRTTGAILLVLLALALALAVVDTEDVPGLGWVNPSGTRALVPLIAIAALYLLPVVTKLKIGEVELEQPAPVSAEALKPAPANWDAVRRKVMVSAAVVQAVTITGSGQAAPPAGQLGQDLSSSSVPVQPAGAGGP